MLQRAPWHADSDAVLQAAGQGDLMCAITALSVANLFYIGRCLVGTEQARNDVRTCLSVFEILAVDRQILLEADGLTGTDFEDNIQIAASHLGSLDAIVTRDSGGFAGSPVTVLLPSELLQRLGRERP